MSGSKASTFLARAALLVLAGGSCAAHVGATNPRSESSGANPAAVRDWEDQPGMVDEICGLVQPIPESR